MSFSVKKRLEFMALLFSAILMITWLLCLRETDSYYSVYVLCTLVGMLCLIDNYRTCRLPTRKILIVMIVFSMWFGTAPVLANYPIFLNMPALKRMLSAACCLVGGFALGLNILLCFFNRIPMKVCSTAAWGNRTHPGRFYGCCFLLITVVYLLYLFCVGYPAYFTPDSFKSLLQIQAGAYINNNPFWWTMLVKLLMDIGNGIFGNVNAAAATYSVIQIIIVAAGFSYVLVTLYQAGMPKWCTGVVCAIYTFLPYNLAYSITMWKDILFSVAALLIVTALYRLLRGIGKFRWLNYLVFALGGVGLCLMRTNGWAVFLAVSVIMALFLQRKFSKLLIIIAVILLICYVLTNPVLAVLNVEPTDFVEALALPFQQLARVVFNEYTLSAPDLEMLEKIFDLEKIPQVFSHAIVDPIKFEVFKQDQRDYLRENLMDYVKLWVRIGLQYPGEYVKAWIELTKGYWNSGYEYWIYYPAGERTDLGIFRVQKENAVSRLFATLFAFLEKPVCFQPLYSIGLHVWILIGCFVINALKKREEFLLTVPALVIIVGLWFGTPVFSEFRYAYPMFQSLPLIVCATLWHVEEKQPAVL